MASSNMVAGSGGQPANQSSLRERYEHWHRVWIRKQNDVENAQNEVASITEKRETLVEELLVKIEELETKQQNFESEKKQAAWKYAQELSRAKKTSENLQQDNDDLLTKIDAIEKNSSDQMDKLEKSKQKIIEEKNGLHERIMDLEAEVHKANETNRALRSRINHPPSQQSRDFRGETWRPAVAARP